MANWHRVGVSDGKKIDVIWHSIMFVLYTILFIVVTILFACFWIQIEFSVEMLIADFLIVFLWIMHKSLLRKNVCIYVINDASRNAKPSLIDKYAIKLMKHYIKRWKPKSFMCCSFNCVEPEDAYKSFDFELVKSYDKKDMRYDACYLYKCKKCGKYVFSLESNKNKVYAYTPVTGSADADSYSERFSYYHFDTLNPVLRIEDNGLVWINKTL